MRASKENMGLNLLTSKSSKVEYVYYGKWKITIIRFDLFYFNSKYLVVLFILNAVKKYLNLSLKQNGADHTISKHIHEIPFKA